MKLGEALSLLKKEQSRLARLISLRRENIFVLEGDKPGFDPGELSSQINKKIDEIRGLKIKIQKSNLNFKIPGENITLAEAILKVGDIRSKISSLSKLFEDKKDPWSFRDKDEKKRIPQLDEQKIEDDLEKLEAEKVQLDNRIQIANWTAQLTD